MYKVKEEDNLMEKKHIDDIIKKYGNLLSAQYMFRSETGTIHRTSFRKRSSAIWKRLLYLQMKNMKKRGFCR